MTGGFVHLGARSEYSLGESLARTADLCRVAARHGQRALAVCDTMSVAAAPGLIEAARTAGLRPLFGLEARVLPWDATGWTGKAHRLRLIATSPQGWARLIQLVNLGHGRAAEEVPPHVTWEEVLADAAHLIVIAGGSDCELTAAVRDDRTPHADRMIAALREALAPEQFFLAIPHPGRGDGAERAAILHALAEAHALPMLAVPEVRYPWAEDALAWEFFRRSDDDDPPRTFADLAPSSGPREHLAPAAELAKHYAPFEGALENTAAVAEMAAFETPRPRRRFPAHEFERGVDAESFIWNEIFSRAAERYGTMPTKWRERLNREFRELVEADLADALICLARLDEEFRERGIGRGPGAGFLTNSLVASLLGMTRTDPLAFDLPFSVPEAAGRASASMQFTVPSTQLGDASEALQELFASHVAVAGKWKRWTAQAALECVLAGIGRKTASEASRIVKSPAWKSAREAAGAREGTGDPPADRALTDPVALAWLTQRLEGRARQLRAVATETVFCSGHAARMLPCPRLDDGQRATEWEPAALEALGFGRIALRPDSVLDLVDEATRWAREQGSQGFEPLHGAAEDTGALALLREGKTTGVPLFEGPLLRTRLRESPPADLKQLLAILAEDAPADPSSRSFETVLLSLAALATRAREKTAFFAAALSQASGNRGRTAALLEAARRDGLSIQPLDLNCSVWRWAPEAGALRPGFQTVHGMNAAAARELEWVRREMTYNDLADLLRRTDPRQLRTAQIESLIRAGALDSLAPSRRQLLDQLPELDELLRPRRLRKGQGDDPLAFFGLGSDWWLQNQVAEPPSLPAEDDDPRWLAEQEHAVTGLLFSFDPGALDREFLRAAHVTVPARLASRDRDEDVTIVGIVEGMEEITAQQGGARTLFVEVAGCLVELSGWSARQAMRCAEAGERVLIAGCARRLPQRLQRSPAEGGTMQWLIEGELLLPLSEAVRRCERAESLEISVGAHDTRTLKQVLALLKHYPGRTPVRLADAPAAANRLVHKLAARSVLVCPGLELGLRRLLQPGGWRLHAKGEEADAEAEESAVVQGEEKVQR